MAQLGPHHHSAAQCAAVAAPVLPAAEGPAHPRRGPQTGHEEPVCCGHVPVWLVHQLVSLVVKYLMHLLMLRARHLWWTVAHMVSEPSSMCLAM